MGGGAVCYPAFRNNSAGSICCPSFPSSSNIPMASPCPPPWAGGETEAQAVITSPEERSSEQPLAPNIQHSSSLHRYHGPCGVLPCPLAMSPQFLEPHKPRMCSRAWLLLTASRAGAGHRGNPEVGGAGVENHGEVLWGGANGDGPVVFHLWGSQGWVLRHGTKPGASPGLEPFWCPPSWSPPASTELLGDVSLFRTTSVGKEG